ncbi:MAG: TetR/AcrR family transcriptional regulator [Bdellovibrionota bacterium]
MTHLLKDELRDIAFREIYQKLQEPKGRRKAGLILEATIKCISKVGFENLTLERVAREAGVSRPLIRYYFTDLDDLKVSAVKYIRVILQNSVVDAISSGSNELESFNLYIDALFNWYDQFRSHAMVWIAFFWYTTQNKQMKELNTIATIKGNERLQRLLENGKKNGYFDFEDGMEAAQNLVTVLNGIITTESSMFHDDKTKMRARYRELALKAVGARSAPQIKIFHVASATTEMGATASFLPNLECELN